METARKVNVDYTLAAANAFATSLTPQLGDGKRFRFVCLSGMLVERDQQKKLWFIAGITADEAISTYFVTSTTPTSGVR